MEGVQTQGASGATGEQLAKHRVAVYAVLVAVLIGVGTLLASFQSYAVAPALSRLDRLEQRETQQERDRSEVLLRLQRVDDRLGRVGAGVGRVERLLGVRR